MSEPTYPGVYLGDPGRGQDDLRGEYMRRQCRRLHSETSDQAGGARVRLRGLRAQLQRRRCRNSTRIRRGALLPSRGLGRVGSAHGTSFGGEVLDRRPPARRTGLGGSGPECQRTCVGSVSFLVDYHAPGRWRCFLRQWPGLRSCHFRRDQGPAYRGLSAIYIVLPRRYSDGERKCSR